MILKPHQEDALSRMHNGCVLVGAVGSGKSCVGLAYYVDNESPKKLYVITTAKKRDSLDWEMEAMAFGIGKDVSIHGTITVDSWNNLHKYKDTTGAFFIFDEQRLVGSGVWAKAFLKIAKANSWILLSATPGDSWLDYIPVFVANGFYKNRTDFIQQHVVFNAYSKYPKPERFVGTQQLLRNRKSILVEMPYDRHTKRELIYLQPSYDVELFNRVWKRRWNVYEERPLKDSGEQYRVARQIVNTDPSRLQILRELLGKHPRLIVWYTFDYELEVLRTLYKDYTVAEWNGHKHEEIPDTESWVYLVQYTSGSEGWNCTTTDAMVFYGLTYSYRLFEQAMGRIDRMNTLYTHLKYYIFMSDSAMDKKIMNRLRIKKNFHESRHQWAA